MGPPLLSELGGSPCKDFARTAPTSDNKIDEERPLVQIARGHSLNLSVYNTDLDPNGLAATRIVQFLTDVLNGIGSRR